MAVIGSVSNGESGASVRAKLNAVISEANKVDSKLESVGASDLRAELTGSVAVAGSVIDWSQGAIFSKTLSVSTSLSFSNVVINKVITLVISGEFALSLPSGCKILSGEYFGDTINYIQVHAISPSVFLTVFSQEV